MMRLKIPVVVSILVLFACADEDTDVNAEEKAIRKACEVCNASRGDMQWFTTLLSGFDNQPSTQGDIYAVKHHDEIIIIHQPLVMSCLGCVLYRCDGTQILLFPVDHQELVKGMNAKNRIYTNVVH